MNGQDQSAERKAGQLDPTSFLKVADAFIDVANRKNRTVAAADLSMAFMYGAARYQAHVARNVIDVEDDEEFVTHMVKAFTEMLRQNLADPNI
jgi:hypothetical protein